MVHSSTRGQVFMTGSADAPMTIRQMVEAGSESYRGWQERQDPEALRTSLRMWSTLTEVVPRESALRPPVLTEFGRALRGWARLTGDRTWLDRAVEASTEAVREGEEQNHPYLDEQLSNLGLVLWERFGDSGHLPDVEEAIAAARRSVALTALDSERRPGRLDNLAQMLLNRFDHTGSGEHHAEAFAATREAAAAMPPGHPQAQVTHFHLSELAGVSYGKTHDPGDLDLWIEAARRVIGLTRPEEPRHPLAWARLARALLTRLRLRRCSGDAVPADDVDDTVRAARRAVELGTPGAPELGRCWLLLAQSLLFRAEPTLDLADLDEARALYERLLPGSPGSARRYRCVWSSPCAASCATTGPVTSATSGPPSTSSAPPSANRPARTRRRRPYCSSGRASTRSTTTTPRTSRIWTRRSRPCGGARR